MITKKTKAFVVAAVIATMSFLLGGAAKADPQRLLNYQGRLVDSNGVPIADGLQNMIFQICTDAACASSVWTEAHSGGSAVQVTDGLFSVILGGITSLNTVDFNSTNYWIQTQIGATVYAPNQQITGAMVAYNVPDSTITSAKVVDNTLTAADMLVNIVTSVDGVTNDGSDIDLVAGSGITITPNDALNTITITATPAGIDHGSLGGLADNDHPQYVLDAGDTMTGLLLMSGPTADITFNNASGVISNTSGGVTIGGNGLQIATGSLGVGGAATMASTLIVTGAATTSSTLNTVGAATFNSTLTAYGAANLSSTLGVVGAITGSSTVQGTRLISTVAIGTAPLTVTSTTNVTNLNADMLDGYHYTSFILDGCTDCLNATEIGDIYVFNSGDTMTGNLVMSAADIDYSDDLGDKTLLYGAAGAAGSYVNGIESSTYYWRSGQNYRWYGALVQDAGVSEDMELDTNANALNMNSKETITYGDSWLRLNNAGSYTSGIYTPGLMRADGGFQVDGATVIDADGRYHYNTTAAGLTIVNKWGGVNTSGWGLDAGNSGDWDVLVYENDVYLQYSNASGHTNIGGDILDYNDTIVNIGEDLGVTGDITVSGTDINMTRGDTSIIHRLGQVSFDWTAGTYDNAAYHGLQSYNEVGALADALRINSYADIINTIDSNGNSTSYFKVQKESTTNGTDLLTLDESGNFWVLGDISASSYATLDARYLNASGGDSGSGGTYNFTNNAAGANVANFTGGADDTNYEWVGWYSGATRMGIFLWDGAWNECLANEFCMTGEGGPMAIDSNGTIYMRDTVDVENNGIVDINWAASDDGSGSGLDADLLDGADSAAYRCEIRSFTVGTTSNCTAGKAVVDTMNGSYALQNPNDFTGGPTNGFMLCCPTTAW